MDKGCKVQNDKARDTDDSHTSVFYCRFLHKEGNDHHNTVFYMHGGHKHAFECIVDRSGILLDIAPSESFDHNYNSFPLLSYTFVDRGLRGIFLHSNALYKKVISRKFVHREVLQFHIQLRLQRFFHMDKFEFLLRVGIPHNFHRSRSFHRYVYHILGPFRILFHTEMSFYPHNASLKKLPHTDKKQ